MIRARLWESEADTTRTSLGQSIQMLDMASHINRP